MNTVTTPIASSFAIPHTRRADLLIALLGSLAIGVLAQVSVPLWPVPVSGQTLGVLAVAATLGARRGSLAVLAYLAQGIAGMPVFAGANAGPAVLAGPTGGYLLGFLPAAMLVGAWFDRSRTARSGRPVPITASSAAGGGAPAAHSAALDLLVTIGALAAATLVVYAAGTVRLSRFVGWDRVVAVGVAPFLVGDALKIALVALASTGIRGACRHPSRPGG
ncbi:MAG: biotin transporter BioY [Spirochaetota bacterium]